MDIRATAEQLQALIAERFGWQLPIVKYDAQPRPAVVIDHDNHGDMYSGATTVHILSVDGTRPDTGEHFRLYFRFAVHEWSGQCDAWSLDITGTRPGEDAAFRELFSPAEYSGYWNNHVSAECIVNGTAVPFRS